MSKSLLYADSQAFFGAQMKPQIRSAKAKLHLAQMTAAPPRPDMRYMQHILRQLEDRIDLFQRQTRVYFVNFASQLQDGNDEQTGVILGLQAPPEDEDLKLSDVKKLRGMGVSFMTLAYDKENRYGGGFASPDTPLTTAGQQLMRWCDEAGIVVDLSHAGHQTARDAIAFADKQQLRVPTATHVACYNVHAHSRNLPIDVLAAIAAQQGYVGILSLPTYLHDSDSSHDTAAFTRHVLEAVEVCGSDYVGVGSDGWYSARNRQDWEADHQAMSRILDPQGTMFSVRFPDQPFEWNVPNRMDLVAATLRQCMRERRVEKIVGRNFYEYIRRTF